MNKRPPISAADAIAAVRELVPDAEATAALIRMLTLEHVAAPRPQGPAGVRAPRTPASGPEPALPTPSIPTHVPRTPTAERRAASITRGAGRATIATRDSATTPAGPPDWLTSVLPIDDAPMLIPMPVTPIFAPARARSILAATVATRSGDGPIAMRRLIEMLCRLEQVRVLPRTPVATLRRGVQLLIDRSSAMDPYTQDVDGVARLIEQVVGLSRVQRLRFTKSPLQAVTRPRRKAEPWREPARGTPVLIVSDMGLGGDALDATRPTREDWLSLARRARKAGCPVIALVPFAPTRWDPVLANVITHVHWDGGVSVGSVRRAIGPGHRIS